MGFFKFNVRKVDDSCVARACRLALAELTRGRTDKVDEVIAATIELVNRRRELLTRLRQVGWKPLIAWKEFEHAMNCPPVGVTTGTCKLRTCKRDLICPFCWARQRVRDPYARFERLLFDNEGRPRADRQLAELHACKIYPRFIHDDYLDKIVTGAKQIRRQVTSSVPEALGAYSISSVSPVEQDWQAHCRVLFVVPATNVTLPNDFECDVDRGASERRNCQLRPVDDHLSLASALGRVATFPAAVFDSSAETLLDLLECTLPKSRSRSYSGWLSAASPSRPRF